MRISGWRIDGFGVLADEAVEDLPSGMTIVVGPNEAGKSTLRAFIVQMLFGFAPRGAGAYPTPGGCPKGGALELVDDVGGTWLLERHGARRGAGLTAPDGRLVDDGALRVLLGGIDGPLYESVFAFGLDELASLGRLGAGARREELFSAGIAGAGRRATGALAQLERRQGVLVRPRRLDTRANALAARLGELDEDLAAARARAGQHGSAAAALRRLEDDLEGARARHAAHRDVLAGLERRLGAQLARARPEGPAATEPKHVRGRRQTVPAALVPAVLVAAVLAAVALALVGLGAGAVPAALAAAVAAGAVGTGAVALIARDRRARRAAAASRRRRRSEEAEAEAAHVEGEVHAARRELERLEALVGELVEARATRRAALEALEASGEIAALELEHGGLEAELASVIEQWRVLGLARVLVERTLKRYEAQRQPAVLRRASEQFAAVTAGRYVRIDASGEDGDRSLGLWSSAGGRLDAGQLSRGTAEQLYLCIRLAAAEQLGRHAAALPLVLDDVLVDLDPDRAAALAACLADAATRQQVLVLTCHPGHVALLTGAAPEARVVSLRPRRATPGTARAPRPSP